MPLHWGGLLGHECPVADFNEMAVGHGDDLGSSHEEGKLSPAHCAAAAAEPNIAVLEAMAMINPMIFSKKGADDRLPLHYAARYSESVGALEHIIQQNPSATRASANPIDEGRYTLSPPLFHVLERPTTSSNTLSIFNCLLEADPGSIGIPDSDGDRVLNSSARCPELNGISAVIEEILRGKPDAAIAGSGGCLHACCSSSPQSLRLWMALKSISGYFCVVLELRQLPIDCHIRVESRAVLGTKGSAQRRKSTLKMNDALPGVP
jgi:hypothetical protein